MCIPQTQIIWVLTINQVYRSTANSCFAVIPGFADKSGFTDKVVNLPSPRTTRAFLVLAVNTLKNMIIHRSP